jgi:hypothetical protein
VEEFPVFELTPIALSETEKLYREQEKCPGECWCLRALYYKVIDLEREDWGGLSPFLGDPVGYGLSQCEGDRVEVAMISHELFQQLIFQQNREAVEVGNLTANDFPHVGSTEYLLAPLREIEADRRA